MTEHWNEHSLDFARPDRENNFENAEGVWNENHTGFKIDTENELTDQDMVDRRKVYEEPHPDIKNLQKRREYTKHVRDDPSYRFLMSVAAFSKKKIGTVFNVVYKTQMYQNKYDHNSPGPIYVARADHVGEDVEVDHVIANTTQSDKNAWVNMPEISGNIQLTPEVYGHIMEAHMIVEGFTKRTISLKVLVEDIRYQSLFARLVAIRMGLTSYFESSDKQKDRIFSRLHLEQTMILRRMNKIKGEQKIDYSNPFYR